MFQITSLDQQVNKSEPSTIPKVPFSMYIVGSKGAGKSTIILNLLVKQEFYRGKFDLLHIAYKQIG